jgi:hypothetical protein
LFLAVGSIFDRCWSPILLSNFSKIAEKGKDLILILFAQIIYIVIGYQKFFCHRSNVKNSLKKNMKLS